MAAGNSCLLGSINLDKFVINQFTNDAKIDFEKLKHVTDIAVRALNIVLDEGLPKHPLQEQKDAVKEWRQIGLGTTSLATALIRLGIKYGSFESRKIVSEIYKTIAEQSIITSLDLAKKDGMYPKCKPELVVKSSFFTQFFDENNEITKEVLKHGLRNCQILTCAPNGSIGSMIGTGSTGIESIFALSYYRTTKTLDSKDKVFKIDVPVVKEYKQLTGNDELPNYFVSVNDINSISRIKIQAAAQQYIDGAISSTCNIPESATVNDVKAIYIEAWKSGCKGCTIFRDNCNRTAILSTKKEEKQESPKFNYISPVSRKTMGTTYGATHCKKCACGTLYITTNFDKDGNLVEVFTHTSKGGICQANMNAVTRMISLGLRSGIKVSEIEDQLKAIHCPACQMNRAKGKNVDGTSCPDIISKVIGNAEAPNIQKQLVENKSDKSIFEKCPECGEKLEHTGGCISCNSCGFSRCG